MAGHVASDLSLRSRVRACTRDTRSWCVNTAPFEHVHWCWAPRRGSVGSRCSSPPMQYSRCTVVNSTLRSSTTPSVPRSAHADTRTEPQHRDTPLSLRTWMTRTILALSSTTPRALSWTIAVRRPCRRSCSATFRACRSSWITAVGRYGSRQMMGTAF